MELPTLSIIVACRNEKLFIANCLDSLIETDYPKNKLEVLVVDGFSEDGTRNIISEYMNRYSFVHLMDNPRKNATSAMNIGIKSAKNQFIAIVGAHASYASDYFSRCAEDLLEYNVDNVGGILKIMPSKDTWIAKTLAKVLSHPFGVGAAPYRTGADQPRLVNTVFGGFYKRDLFERIGLFNDDLMRSQDIYFNKRLCKRGGKILLDPRIQCNYYVKSKLKDFAVHVFDDGRWVFLPLKLGYALFYPKHLITLIFVLALGISFVLSLWVYVFCIVLSGIGGAYVIANLLFSLQIAIQTREARFFVLMPLGFATRHFAHGLGALFGLCEVLTASQFWKRGLGALFSQNQCRPK